MRIKIACRDPSKIPFERLIEMKKKLFLLGFTIEGFEQVGGKGSVVEIEDEDEDDNFEEGNGNQEHHDLPKNDGDDDLYADNVDMDEPEDKQVRGKQLGKDSAKEKEKIKLEIKAKRSKMMNYMSLKVMIYGHQMKMMKNCT